MGKGAVSNADPRSLMTLGSGAEGEAASAITEADLVLTVGYDIAEHDLADWNCDAAIVHIDSEPAEVYEAYNPEVEVVADIERTLRELLAWCRGADLHFDLDWYAGLREQIVPTWTARRPARRRSRSATPSRRRLGATGWRWWRCR